MTRVLKRLLNTTCSTQRPPAVSGGKRGTRATYLQSVSIAVLMPASAATLEGTPLQSAATELWETYTASHAHTKSAATVTEIPDIRQGDIVVVSAVEYRVEYVGNWGATSGTDAYIQIVLEENSPAA